MVRPRLATIFVSLTASTTLAAPTRVQQQHRINSHCRCTVFSTTENPFAPIYTPSAAHWTPAEPSPSASSTPLPNTDRDSCSDLGPALQGLAFTYPDIYDELIPRHNDDDDVPRPRRTTFLLDLDVYEDILDLQSHPRRSSQLYAASEKTAQIQSQQAQPQQQNHIRCHTEASPDTLSATLAASAVTNLWATQIIVALLIFACFVEVAHLATKWFLHRNAPPAPGTGPRVRLHGTEAQLLAIPTSIMHEKDRPLFSPGAEKKARAYESAPKYVMVLGRERREAYAYAYPIEGDYEDDEVSRPVM